MSVAVLAPFTGGCEHREAAWAHVQARWEGWELHTGDGNTDAGYSRSRAILDAASKTDADVLVVTDADVFLDGPIEPALIEAERYGWAVPHLLLHRLSPESTRLVLDGADWHGLPLSQDNPQDRKPYRGNETGTLVVVTREALNTAPPDPRFVQWGSEDEAWGKALRTLVGPPWRGSADLVHLWHPPQPRRSRTVGNPANAALARRYHKARHNPAAMRALIEEVRECLTPRTSWSSPAP